MIVVCGGASPFGVELVKFAHSPYPPTSTINCTSKMSTTHNHHSPPLPRTWPPEQSSRSQKARGLKRVYSVQAVCFPPSLSSAYSVTAQQQCTTMETCLQEHEHATITGMMRTSLNLSTRWGTHCLSESRCYVRGNHFLHYTSGVLQPPTFPFQE